MPVRHRSATGSRPTYGLVAADQLTCGAHVHVDIGSRAEGIAVINAVRPWLSVLLALSANSPFWSGSDSGYASHRSVSVGALADRRRRPAARRPGPTRPNRRRRPGRGHPHRG